MLKLGGEHVPEDDESQQDEFSNPPLETKYKDPPLFEDNDDVYLCYTRPGTHHIHATDVLYETHTLSTYPKSWSKCKASHGSRKLREAYSQRNDYYYKVPAFRVVSKENLDSIIKRLSTCHTFSTRSKVTSVKSAPQSRRSTSLRDDSASQPQGSEKDSSANRMVVTFKEPNETTENEVKDKSSENTANNASYDSNNTTSHVKKCNGNLHEENGSETQKLSEAEVAARIHRLCRGTSTSRIREASVKYKGKKEYADSVKKYSRKENNKTDT